MNIFKITRTQYAALQLRLTEAGAHIMYDSKTDGYEVTAPAHLADVIKAIVNS